MAVRRHETISYEQCCVGKYMYQLSGKSQIGGPRLQTTIIRSDAKQSAVLSTFSFKLLSKPPPPNIYKYNYNYANVHTSRPQVRH